MAFVRRRARPPPLQALRTRMAGGRMRAAHYGEDCSVRTAESRIYLLAEMLFGKRMLQRGNVGRVSAFAQPEPFAAVFHVGQVEAQVEFELVVLRLHPAAQLVEGLVVLLFLQVRYLMCKKIENGQPNSLITKGVASASLSMRLSNLMDKGFVKCPLKDAGRDACTHQSSPRQQTVPTVPSPLGGSFTMFICDIEQPHC